SNLYIDLAPVVVAAAVANDKTARLIENDGDAAAGENRSDWILVAADPGFFDSPLFAGRWKYVPASVKPWTDDYSNLWSSLR
ncbi:MAG TPA: hypothetical protein VG798_05370, partial [Rhizomicrobium sp.]|nr:hypothetical protein [Rhizomicrobium sp.]